MNVVQEGQRLHTLVEFVAQGIGVAILPRPSCEPLNCVVIRKLEDFDLPANLHFTWLHRNDSSMLRDFIATVRQVVLTPGSGLWSSHQSRNVSSVTLHPQSRPREARVPRA